MDNFVLSNADKLEVLIKMNEEIQRIIAHYRTVNQGHINRFEIFEANALAVVTLEAKLRQLKKQGNNPRKELNTYRLIEKKTAPLYPINKFPNKWRKIRSDLPAKTHLVYLRKGCYLNIHFESKQARSISVREVSRSQSFSDKFNFHGSNGSLYRQIGKAVPSLSEMNLAIKIKRLLGYY